MSEFKPIIFMHIPKTAGTALTKCLIDAISPEGIATGVDASIFCGIDDFDSFSKDKKGFVYKNASEIPRDVQLVSGHISASILRQAFPRGRFMTVLREPLSRTLSFWLYWRGLSDAALEPWGDEWAHQVKLSRGSFLSFIRVKSLACNNDNPATRMLLWPSKLIPSRDFIDEKLDDDIIDQALSVLSSFDFIDFIENVYFSRNLEQWLQKRVVLSRQNETTSMPDHLKTPMTLELFQEAMHEAARRSRLDLRLWKHIASKTIGLERLETFRRDHLRALVAHYDSALMAH